jgi:hypothetical protein
MLSVKKVSKQVILAEPFTSFRGNGLSSRSFLCEYHECRTHGMPSLLVSKMRILVLQHDYYLQELVSKYGLGSKDKAARVVLDYAMTSGDESTIFEVKRCRHGSTCKNC